MFRQASNIIRIIRLKHMVNAVRSPIHTLEAFKYHFRRVAEREFVEFLSDKWGCTTETVDSAYGDLYSHQKLWDKIIHDFSTTPESYGSQMTKDGPSLYLLVRLCKPTLVVETGVAAGISSCFILQGLSDNDNGHLFSIDLLPQIKPYNKNTGWLVPDNLRHRWELQIGDTKKLLIPLLDKLRKMDCFIHDSLHTYEHMLWEFRTAWNHIREKGLFLSHDVGANRAFFDFMKEVGIGWRDYRVHGLIGGFQRKL
jgi:hypothetical protein